MSSFSQQQLLAGLAASLEESKYSAIYRRILAAKQQEAELSLEAFQEDNPEGLYAFSSADAETLYADCWLSPITANGPLLTADSLRAPQWEPSRAVELRPTSPPQAVVEGDAKVGAEEEQEQTCRRHGPADLAASDGVSEGDAPSGSDATPPRRPRRRRASDAAILDIPWPEYLRVVKAVAALTIQERQNPATANIARLQLEETLTRWGVNPQAWLLQLEQLDNRCTRALGAPHRMMQRAAEMAQQWLQGIQLCREIFLADTSPPDAPADEFT